MAWVKFLAAVPKDKRSACGAAGHARGASGARHASEQPGSSPALFGKDGETAADVTRTSPDSPIFATTGCGTKDRNHDDPELLRTVQR
jgi:hypothetical protein